jgi:hypothetical protein
MDRLAIALVLVLAACGPSRRAWRPEASSASSLGPSTYAVVASGTPLAIAPRDGAPSFVLGQRFAVLRVIGIGAGWATLETVAGGAFDGHCVPGVARLEPFRLRFSVRERALSPLTQREIVQSFPDGTRIELARGVPVEALPGSSLVRAHLGDVSTVLRLERADVGTRYVPSRGFEEPSSVRGWVRADALAAAVPIVGGTGRVESHAPIGVPVVAIEGSGSEVLAQIRPRCARLTVRMPAHAIGATDFIAGTLVGESPEPYVVRAGAPLYWRDGTEAGVVATDVRFARELEPSGERRCFSRVIVFEPREVALELCAARRDVSTGEDAARVLDSPGL